MRKEIFDCPFCGGIPKIDVYYGFNVCCKKYWNGNISCKKCGAKMEAHHWPSREEAERSLIERWNMRERRCAQVAETPTSPCNDASYMYECNACGDEPCIQRIEIGQQDKLPKFCKRTAATVSVQVISIECKWEKKTLKTAERKNHGNDSD